MTSPNIVTSDRNADHHTAANPTYSFRTPPKSNKAALVAISLFLLINLGLSANTSTGNRLLKKPEETNATAQACDSALYQYAASKSVPEIVLIGSSVLMAPTWSVDSQVFPQVPDVYHHHRWLSLESKATQKRQKQTSVFTFALPGLMVSDGYLIVDKVLNGKLKPKLIGYALTPRDFMDDLMTGETRTITFNRLMRLNDIARLGSAYLSSPQEALEFVIDNVCYLYGKRYRYQEKCVALLRKVSGALLGPGATVETQRSTIGAQQFLLIQDRQLAWGRSIEEYRNRYKHFDRAQFEKQVRFLSRLLLLARERGIDLALINMPLTDANKNLMPTGFYQYYKSTINNIARNNSVPIIDLDKGRGYSDDCFYDTVHLNAVGGKRLLGSIAAWFNSNKILR